MSEWLVPGLIAAVGGLGKMAYGQVMGAFRTMQVRDDALAKRIIGYETANNTKHLEIIDRLSHVEALVNGKERTR